MDTWQEATSRQVKLLTGRLNELLSDGLELLHSELGVDLKPVIIPQWLVLLAACIGLVLMVVLWASVCRGLFHKRPTTAAGDDRVEIKPVVTKSVTKSEEQKKKKKKTDKKAQAVQPNGRAFAESQDQVMVPEEAPPPEVKAEKVSEVKKSKKKGKQAGKETKAADGKEPEEGTWETKVSNKEKREQRKKDKTSSDGSASPGGTDTPRNTPPERSRAEVVPAKASAPAPVPAGQRKKKGEPSKVKAEKEPAVSQVNSSDGVVSDVAVKVPSRPTGKAPGHWAAKQEPASLWRAEIDGSWTVIESGMKTSDLNLVSFSGLGVGSAEHQPMSDLPWLSQPKVEDEWSGLNGGSLDPSSDWNAPSEAWGHYEETISQAPAPHQEPVIDTAEVNLLIRAVDDYEEDKDKIEVAADGAAKSKKKKKKKKKAAEEGAGQENEEPERDVAQPPARKVQPVQEAAPAVVTVQPVKAAPPVPRKEKNVKENISQKSPVTQVPQKQTDKGPTVKQNNLPAPAQQKKPEESQASKPAKKKKARRET